MDWNFFTYTILALLRLSAQVHSKRGLRTERDVSKVYGEEEEALTIPLTYRNSDYYGEITVGTALPGEKPQVLSVNFDTGSQHLWLASDDACENKICQGQLFKPYIGSKSSTFRKTKERFKMAYVDGTEIKGYLVQDTIKIGSGDKKIVMASQVFGMAESIKTDTLDTDGVFGLGIMPQTLPGNPDPPLISMMNQNKIRPVFGFYLQRNNKEANAGMLVFGEISHDLIEGDFTYHDVVNVNGVFNKWNINIDKITIGKDDFVEFELVLENFLALSDSGCNTISGPSRVMSRLNAIIFQDAKFEVTDKYKFSCDVSWWELPDVTFIINQQLYILTPDDYVWGQKHSPRNPQSICKSGFIGREGKDHITLGHIFMQRYYTEYDVSKKRVGFAKAKTP